MEKKTYKAKLHIPTRDFEFIEIELEDTPEEIVETNRHFNSLVKSNGEGISRKDFVRALDQYLTKHTGSTQEYLDMSSQQQLVFQELKRAFKRITKK